MNAMTGWSYRQKPGLQKWSFQIAWNNGVLTKIALCFHKDAG